MARLELETTLNRRDLLALGGRTAGSLILAAGLGVGAGASPRLEPESVNALALQEGTQHQVEQIIQAQGKVSQGVLSIEIERKDITDVKLRGVPILPAFQLSGSLNFQQISAGRVVMNSDMALKPSELNPFIDQLLQHNLVFQAEHQHFYDFSPQVWFIHFRGVGTPAQLAHGVKAALSVTSTPFPQTMPTNPTTTLPVEEISKILGVKAAAASHGLVKASVPRIQPITLGGIPISPRLNIQTSIAFQPYGGGQNVAAVCDFGMTAAEVQPLVGLMRRQGWDIGCLYNQETAEQPQLYFSHQFKTGNVLELAHELRSGLDRTDSKFKT